MSLEINQKFVFELFRFRKLNISASSVMFVFLSTNITGDKSNQLHLITIIFFLRLRDFKQEFYFNSPCFNLFHSRRQPFRLTKLKKEKKTLFIEAIRKR